jgi:hypothetical protein
VLKLTLNNLNPIDCVPFKDGVHRVHASGDLREHCEVVIKSRVVHEIYEDLGVAGVTTAGGDSDCTADVRTKA